MTTDDQLTARAEVNKVGAKINYPLDWPLSNTLLVMAASEVQQRQVITEQDKLKLLRLENEFYRSCNVIRQNGVELQQLRAFLVKELLDLEVRKREKMDKQLNRRIEELQVRPNLT